MRNLHRLTSRELEIIRAILDGATTSQEVAERLTISYRTVRSHLTNIYLKAGVKSQARLILMCLDRIERAPALRGYKF